MSNDPNGAARRSPFRPTITAQISLGNLITIVGGIAAIAAGWSNLNGGMAANAESVARTEQSVREVREDTSRLKSRVRANEIAVSRQDERTNSILTGIARIEIQLQRLSERLDRRNGQ